MRTIVVPCVGCGGNRCGPRRHALATRLISRPSPRRLPAGSLSPSAARPAAERLQQLGLALFACAQEALLDRPEAADPVGDRRPARPRWRGLPASGRAAARPSAPRSRAISCALGAALGRVAEEVEPGAAQALEPCEQAGRRAASTGRRRASRGSPVTGSGRAISGGARWKRELPVALEHGRRSGAGSRCRCRAGRPRTRPCRP